MKTALSRITDFIRGGVIPTERAGNSTILTSKKGKTMGVEDYLFTAKDGESYGVFKLTPRECGRLMGVTDADIDKMFAVNSNSQCYKQFGNSIVVPLTYHLSPIASPLLGLFYRHSYLSRSHAFFSVRAVTSTLRQPTKKLGRLLRTW